MDAFAHFNSLQVLQTLDGYRQHFMDLGIWEPIVREVCARHRLSCVFVRPGVAGTYPTFIIDDNWVIKFFGPLFGGYDSFNLEERLGEILFRYTQIPAAKVLRTGSFYDGSTEWFYIVFEYVHGNSIGEDYRRITFEDQVRLAQRLGRIVHSFHHIPLQDVGLPGFTCTRERYNSRLREWFRQRLLNNETRLPEHLSVQAVDYLARVDRSVAMDGNLYLIHADLTRDHILGHFTGDHWELDALIDFGDAMPGDIFYELAALHLDAFDCDKRLLAAFLEPYGLEENDRMDFEAKCMAAALQHQFDVFSPLFERFPGLHKVGSLDEISALLWDVQIPGIYEG